LVKVSAAFKNKRIFSLTGWRASANGEIQHFNSSFFAIRATGAPPPKTFQLEAQRSRNRRSADCQVNGFSPRLFVSGK